MAASVEQWQVDEWREKFNDCQKRLEHAEKEREFHTAKLEQTVAWQAVRLCEAEATKDAFKGDTALEVLAWDRGWRYCRAQEQVKP